VDAPEGLGKGVATAVLEEPAGVNSTVSPVNGRVRWRSP
jgi:hypothetical protein